MSGGYGRPKRKRRCCTYCHRPFARDGSATGRWRTHDHIVPQSQGGTATVKACHSCNQVKADKSPAEWAAYMAAHPRWWVKHHA